VLRRTFILATCLVLGIAISIAVAWRVAMSSRRQFKDQAVAWPTPTPGVYIVDVSAHEPGWTEHTYSTVNTLSSTDHEINVGVGIDSLVTVPLSTAPIPTEAIEYRGCNQIIVSSAGFPFRCVHHAHWYRGNGLGWTPIADRGFLTIRALSDAPLPAAPLWPGLIADTAIYAAFCWAALVCVPVTRRAVRHRRNLCVACAYDRRGLAPGAPCPECGKP
jgi:hypothetical protein